MKYQVIARKFRPQVFEEVVGQAPIVQTLRNAIEMGRIGHAYLFSGPRGVGKTTMARLLAKALNCTNGPTVSPCNECPSCSEVSMGGSIDVLEIDAASNTGVDSIRELRENARYAPSRDRFKIFIIDEVHMLSTSAFNALLKTLEEPPDHIAFIMATTERHKLPATILSRCQQFVFRSIPPPEIHEHLKSIVEREDIRVGEGALEYVVKAAGGSMRDAQSLLDQIIAFAGQEVSDEDVRDVLGFMPASLLDDSLTALAERDPVRLLEVVEQVTEQGLNLQQFVRELLAEIRSLLLTKIGLNEKIAGSPDDKARIEAQAVHFSEQDLIRFFDVLMQVEGDLRWTSEPRFHLEVGCIKLTQLGRLADIEHVIRDLKALAPGAGPGADAVAPEPGKQPARASAPAATASQGKANAPPREPRAPKPRQRAAVAQPQPAPAPQPVSAQSSSVAIESETVSQSPENVPKPAPVAPPPESRTAPTPADSGTAALKEAAEAEPAVQSFLDVFRGEIAHVRGPKNPEQPEDDR